MTPGSPRSEGGEDVRMDTPTALLDAIGHTLARSLGEPFDPARHHELAIRVCIAAMDESLGAERLVTLPTARERYELVDAGMRALNALPPDMLTAQTALAAERVLIAAGVIS